MIKKIQAIKNVGKFVDYSAVGDVELHQLTLVFGENGRGKSTLSAIFRSLRTADSNYILERSTLGCADLPQVTLVLEGGPVTFKKGKWSSSADLEIFDSAFVNENVFSGNTVEHDHRKNLYRFVIGEQGIQLAKAVDELDINIRDFSNRIKLKEQEVQCLITGKLAVDDFINLARTEEVDQRIEEKEDEIKALEEASAIQNTATLNAITLPSVNLAKYSKILSATVSDLSRDAEARTRQHIQTCMDAKGETWVRDGLGYVQDSKCPFCGQQLGDDSLLRSYQGYFNAAYVALKQEIALLASEAAEDFSEAALLKITNKVAANDKLSEFWGDHVPVEYPKIALERIQSTWASLREALKYLLGQKLASPLEAITADESSQIAIKGYEDLTAEVATYNQMLATANKHIAALKLSLAGKTLQSAQQERIALLNSRARYTAEAIALCDGYVQLLGSKKSLESDKAKKKVDLDEYTQDVFGKYEAQINSYLGLFSAGFRIEGVTTSFAGGKPSSDYHISINNTVVDLGAGKASGKPSFKSTLSDGDKHALAFAFFLARLDQDPDLSKKTVIFDDPITSLDSNRKTCTKQQIIRISTKAKQVIVLSHDQHFLKMLWDEATKAKALWISRNGEHSLIEEWDIHTATQSDYQRSYTEISEYIKMGHGKDPRQIARSIRPALEGNLRARFPEDFKPTEWLGDLIEKARKAQPGEPLERLTSLLPDIIDVNDYSKKYHHQQNPNADAEPVNEAELKSYAQRALKVISS